MNDDFTIVVENEGRPEICTKSSNLEFCIKHETETYIDEFGQTVPEYYAYRIILNENGFAELEVVRKYR